MKSWLEVAENSDFPIQNIPFGIIQKGNADPVAATRIGDYVINLAVLAENAIFQSLELNDISVFFESNLNAFISLGKDETSKVRKFLIELFEASNATLRDNNELREASIYKLVDVEVLLPVEIGDYTDFYSSMEHATNVGKLFRDPDNALLPNWKHIPVGYHGRSSSIVASGTNIRRPMGQTVPLGETEPVFGPCKALDFELEMAFITGKNTQLGERIDVNEAEDYIFGMVVFNDLSARDIQKWEYVPLGPFLGKSFGSVISPWIITLDALEPFRTSSPKQDPEVLPYLQYNGDHSFDIELEVFIQPEGGEAHKVCYSNYKHLYWNMNQQLAHQSVNGCNINVGDMYASGTISGPEEGSFGSMLELTYGGKKPIQMPDGSERKYILDNDSLIMTGTCQKDGLRIGFGECIMKVLPAK
jgi:fumarylacetoacetase